jgi:hypothetical protein
LSGPSHERVYKQPVIECEVLVVGAGPGALTLERELRARGVDARRVDALPGERGGGGEVRAERVVEWGEGRGPEEALTLAWKLALVCEGDADPALLDSYEAERRPVAAATIDAATAQESRPAVVFADPHLDEDGPVGDAARARVTAALVAKRGEFHSLGLVLGAHYAGSPVVLDDGSPVPPADLEHYRPSARPGARLPHHWCADGSSLYDHLGRGLTLLHTGSDPASGGLVTAARRLGVPLTLLEVPPATTDGVPLALVRPDQHVAWRGAAPTDPTGVLRAVCGALAVPDRPARPAVPIAASARSRP